MVQGEKEEADDKEEKHCFEICLFQVKCHINLTIKSFFVLILYVCWGWCQRLYHIAENLHPEMGLECFKQWYSETSTSGKAGQDAYFILQTSIDAHHI